MQRRLLYMFWKDCIVGTQVFLGTILPRISRDKHSSAPGTLAFDLEIEKTAKANRKETKLRKKQSVVVGTQSNLPPEIRIDDEVESRVNENPTQTLESKEEEVDSPEEVLNTKVDENPNLTPQLMAQTIGNWPKRRQNNRHYASPELRREIVGIRQKDAETLYDYWERFKKLCASCPQHGITEQSLLQYFYEGLKPMEMNMVDAASGGALVNMTPQPARDLISTMAANSQQFRANPEPPRRVHQLSNSTIEDRLDRLTNIVNSLITEKSKPARVCGICATPEHTTDACSSLCDDSMAHLDAVGNFPGLPQRRYDPYANTYNPGWRDHPNFSYGANP
ncbi:hypothetical protein PVK06_009775 [Gossypium arboreum]|uniref:Retrotransposon gag domain-containing protein n=1 Tax=Gossypium arboreum TaxID=29729 RepID=A0ABR0QNG0_GOSAR|nr:hypothetical protein PVK06_009775 [Gossypium arboreum]